MNYKGSRLATTLAVVLFLFYSAHSLAVWNNPYSKADSKKNILYTAFQERPKRLDPARSYSSNEYVFIANIYEPPFQYHYLKRPYQLEPLTATELPVPEFFNSEHKPLAITVSGNEVAYSIYTIRLRKGILYQPHPALARDNNGKYSYHNLQADVLEHINVIGDFKLRGTRELVAEDYVYQIKRLADPRLHSPIYGLMSRYIVGLKSLSEEIKTVREESEGSGEEALNYVDLTALTLEGVRVIDRYTYEIKIHGKYPQFLYWMAMPFFAPMPPEADYFFSQPGMKEKNLSLNWYAVGTGPYMLTVNDPNRKMVLEKNPNYHQDLYPADGEAGDEESGMLNDAGKQLPFIDKVIFSLEKEGIPYWNKFLQGYYDRSAISAESFDQAINVSSGGDMSLTDEMQKKGIRLLTSVAASTYYLGFNMLDPVVGGYTERARLLRQVISIAVDYEEQISIFRNGRGIPAQGPIPPGIFGYRSGQQGLNRYVYDWVQGRPQRKSIEEAKKLLAEAGYPGGRDQVTGKPLLLYFDTTGTGPEEKARLDWMRKQFQKIDIQLVIRATDYNRFQDKMQNGDAQMFVWGWNADYPDPENFLFLLYGGNKKVVNHGENASNYGNPEFDRLFNKMKNMSNSDQRLSIIDRMSEIVRRDAPWLWGVHPKQFTLQHKWLYNSKPNLMANNTLKYIRLDTIARTTLREQWNKPVIWPIGLALILLVLAIFPLVRVYRRREYGRAL